MRETPKMRERPEATRKRNIALASPAKLCNANWLRVTRSPG
jgi:hypothetical protein